MKKAYSVQDDESGCVVFAETGVVARREGANELNIEFEDVISCRRAPEFDQYAEAGKVPMQAFMDAGWWMACANCEQAVYGDHDGHLVHDDAVYCCEACRDADLAYGVMMLRRNQAITDWAHEKWPGSTVTYAYYFNGDAYVNFNFPGCTGLATFDRGRLTIRQCDVPAWDLFVGNPVGQQQ